MTPLELAMSRMSDEDVRDAVAPTSQAMTPRGSPPARTKRDDPLGRAISQMQFESAVPASLNVSQGPMNKVQPDTLASYKRLANSLREPVQQIMADPTMARSRDLFERTQEFLKRRPQLIEFLSNPENAALTYDDLESISELSNLLQAARQSEIRRGFGDYDLEFISDFISGSVTKTLQGTKQLITENFLPSSTDELANLQMGVGGFGGGPHISILASEPNRTALRKTLSRDEQFEYDSLPNAAAQREYLSAAIDKELKEAKASRLKEIAFQADIVDRELKQLQSQMDPDTFARYVADATIAVAQMTPGVLVGLLTRNPWLGSSVMGAQATGSRYYDARARGFSEKQALGEATLFGLLEVLTEKIPLGILTDPKGGALKSILKSFGAESIQEGLLQTIDNAYMIGVADQEMTGGQFFRSIADASVVGGIAGTQMSTLMSPLAWQRNQMQQALDGLRSAKRLAKAQEQVAAAKLTERSPETMRELLSELNQDDDVLLSSEGVQELLSQGQEGIEVLQQLGVDLESISPGADVQVQMSGLLMLEKADFTGLADHIRLAVGDYTSTEARALIEENESIIAERVAQAEAAVEADPEARPIFDAVSQALMDAGQTRSQAASQAELYESRYNAMAELYEDNVTAEQLFFEQNLTLRSGGIDAPVRLPSEIERTLDTLVRDAEGAVAQFLQDTPGVLTPVAEVEDGKLPVMVRGRLLDFAELENVFTELFGEEGTADINAVLQDPAVQEYLRDAEAVGLRAPDGTVRVLNLDAVVRPDGILQAALDMVDNAFDVLPEAERTRLAKLAKPAFERSEVKLEPEQERRLDAMYLLSVLNYDAYKDAIEQLAAAVEGVAGVAGLKGRKRATEKIAADYKGDPAKLKDMLRSTIVVRTIEDAQDAWNTLNELYTVYPETVRTSLLEDGPGYRDIKAVIDFNGIAAEIQINIPSLLVGKEFGHAFYEIERHTDTPVEAAKAAKAAQEKLYEGLADVDPDSQDLSALSELVKGNAISIAASEPVLSGLVTKFENMSLDTMPPFLIASAQLYGSGGAVSNLQATPGDSTATGMPSTDISSDADAISSSGVIDESSSQDVIIPLEQSPALLRGKAQAERARVSTRVPSAKGFEMEDALGYPQLNAGFKSVPTKGLRRIVDEWKDKAAELLMSDVHPGSGARPGMTTNAALSAVIRRTSDNLKWLYNSVPESHRAKTRRWYNGAKRVSRSFATRYNFSEEQSTAVIAVLSPGTDWFQNVSHAERLLDIWTQHQDTAWSSEMDKATNTIAWWNKAKSQQRRDKKLLRGKTLRDFDGDVYMQALWVRAYIEGMQDLKFRSLSPTGNFTDWVRKKNGAPAKFKVQSVANIIKALQVITQASDRSNISSALGANHKVRSFYNNIIAPDSDAGDVTMDTHAIAAAFLMPLSISSPQVEANFGTPANAHTGFIGLYNVHAEAYRKAAADLGILPRELQSVTWEAVREMFPREWKSTEALEDVEAIWREVDNGTISPAQARKRILDYAPADPGSPTPVSDTGAAAHLGRTSYERKLPDGGVRQPARGRSGSRPTGALALEQLPALASPYERETRAAFTKWFGRSKAKDVFGRPKVMYHGTDAEFRQFRSNAKNPLYFISPTEEGAQYFANYQARFPDDTSQHKILPLYVKAEQPFDSTSAAQVEQIIDLLQANNPNVDREDLLDDVLRGSSNWELIEADNVIERIKELGYDSIQVTEGGAKNLAVFEPTQLKVADGSNRTFDPNNADIYFQPAGPEQRSARGAYLRERNYYGDISNIIELSEDANLSTFLHESGHFFLHELHAMQSDPRLSEDGAKRVAEQMAGVQGWFKKNAKSALADMKKMERAARKAGNTERADLMKTAIDHAEANGGVAYMEQVADGFMDGSVEWGAVLEIGFHEQWARGFEQYLGEGRSPSKGLKRAFLNFASWMGRIYSSLSRLNVNLTPEVRDVMDQLLATQEAIAEARAAEDAGISATLDPYLNPTQREALKQAAADADVEARSQLIEKQAEASKQRLTAEYKAAREKYTEEETAALADEPLYVVRRWLREGIAPDGTEQYAKIDRAEMESLYGKDAVRRMLSKTLTKKGEQGEYSIDAIAAITGYQSGAAMIDDLTNPHFSEAQIVRNRVEQRLQAEFGTKMDPATLQEAAMESVDADAEADLVALRLRILRSLTSQSLENAAQRRAEQEGVPTTASEDKAATEAAQADLDTPAGQGEALAAEAIQAGNRPQRRAQVAAGKKYRELVRQLDVQAARDAAAQQVGSMRVLELTPQKYRAAALRYAKRAQSALAKRDVDAAIQAMEQQLVHIELARAVQAAQERSEKTIARFKRLNRSSDKRLATRYELDIFNTVRFILGRMDIGQSKAAVPVEQADRLRGDTSAALAFRERTAEALLSTAEARTSAPRKEASTWELLTYSELSEIIEIVDETLAEARDAAGMLIDGRRIHFNEVYDEMDGLNASRLPQGSTDSELGSSIDRKERERRALHHSFSMQMRRVESWAVRMDNGNPEGPYTQYIVRPITRAVTAYKTAQSVTIKQLMQTLSEHAEVWMQWKPIAAPEIGWEFKNKAELLHAVLHSGNESNLRKLLLGGQMDADEAVARPWGSQRKDGTVDDTQWRSFLDRMFREEVLTKSDMDLVQKLWDMAEQMKPAAQEAHKRAFGRYFPEIEPTELQTPFGSYRGGYVPAISDAMMNPDAGFNADLDGLVERGGANALPGAEKGFTNQRIESYNEPLLLDLTLLPVHFDTVLKFTHFAPTVRNVGRLVMNKRFTKMHHRTAPDAVRYMLVPWLERVARQQTVKTSDMGKDWDRRINNLNRAVGKHYMFANIINVAQQVTGFLSSMVQLPPGEVLQGVFRAITDRNNLFEYIQGRSPYMAVRLDNSIDEAARTVRDFLLDPTPIERSRAFGDKHAYIMQQGLQNWMDIAVWSSAERVFYNNGQWRLAYDAAVALGKTEEDASIAADTAAAEWADGVVRQTQAAMDASDVAAMEVGNPLWRVATKFITYFNAMYNLNLTAFGVEKEVHGFSRPHKLMYLYAVGIMLPAVIAEAMSMAARGDFDDLEDDEPLELAAKLANLLVFSQLKFIAGAVPGGSAVIGMLQGATTSQTWDDKLSVSPVIGPVEQVGAGVSAIIQSTVEGEVQKPDKIARGALTGIALYAGIPANWLTKPLTYGIKVQEGKAAPENALDILQGVLTGRDGTEN